MLLVYYIYAAAIDEIWGCCSCSLLAWCNFFAWVLPLVLREAHVVFGFETGREAGWSDDELVRDAAELGGQTGRLVVADGMSGDNSEC